MPAAPKLHSYRHKSSARNSPSKSSVTSLVASLSHPAATGHFPPPQTWTCHYLCDTSAYHPLALPLGPQSVLLLTAEWWQLHISSDLYQGRNSLSVELAPVIQLHSAFLGLSRMHLHPRLHVEPAIKPLYFIPPAAFTQLLYQCLNMGLPPQTSNWTLPKAP